MFIDLNYLLEGMPRMQLILLSNVGSPYGLALPPRMKSMFANFFFLNRKFSSRKSYKGKFLYEKQEEAFNEKLYLLF